MSLRNFFDELKRRHVLRVTGVYLVAAWVMIQVVATVVPVLGWPDGVARGTVITAVLGLPVVVLLAWFFDLTPQGIKRTAALDPAAPIDLRHVERRLAARAVGFIGVGILVALVGFAAFNRDQGLTGRTSTSEIESLAVLPFVDLSPAHDQEYFSDGVAEELINRLSQIDSLRVAARTSSFAFKDQNLEIGEIARRLGVQAVVEGSVRRDGDDLRVSVRLADARSGETLWSNTFTHTVSSIFAIQDTIATSIVDALKLEIAGTLATDSRQTTDPRAYDAYLKGLQHWNRRTEEDLKQAILYFTMATERDSTFALAYAGLAQAYAVLPSVGVFPIDSALARGKDAAARALDLSVNLGEAYAALGQIAQNFQWDISSAERYYRRAIKFNPSYATARQWYAEAMMMLGDYEEAKREIDAALELDQLSPAGQTVDAYLQLVSGETESALRAFQTQVRSDPNLGLAQLNLGLAALLAGRHDLALPALLRGMPGHRDEIEALVAGARDASARAAGVSAVDRLARSQPPSLTALLYAALGQKEKALGTLERGYAEARDANFPYMLLHPLFRPYRTEPRFTKLFEDLGLSIPPA